MVLDWSGLLQRGNRENYKRLCGGRKRRVSGRPVTVVQASAGAACTFLGMGELKQFPGVGKLTPGLEGGQDQDIPDWFWWAGAGVCLLTPVLIAWLYL